MASAASADPNALLYTGVSRCERAEIYPVRHAGAGPWRIRLSQRLIDRLEAQRADHPAARR